MIVHGSYNSYLEGEKYWVLFNLFFIVLLFDLVNIQMKIERRAKYIECFPNKHLHFIEIRNGSDVHQINNCKVFYFIGDAVEYFVHFHTSGVPIVAKSDNLMN